MIILSQSASPLNESNPIKKIEMAARVCYKSESDISDGTDIKMFNTLYTNGHLAMLEHGHFLFVSKYCTEDDLSDEDISVIRHASSNQYFNITSSLNPDGSNTKRVVVSANIRAILDCNNPIMRLSLASHLINIGAFTTNNFESVDYYMSIKEYINPSNMILTSFYDDSFYATLSITERLTHSRLSYHIITDRGITHELVRHRVFSFAQESTRYCNYTNNKFGAEISVIEPLFDKRTASYQIWVDACRDAETRYFELINGNGNLEKATPQEARSILPNSLKSEIIMTGNITNWFNFFDLRYFEITGKVHPQMKELSSMMYTNFYNTLSNDYGIEGMKEPIH